MRVPLSWLAEYVDLSPATTPEDVHAALVSVGFEEEEIHRFQLSGPIVVGEVLEFVEEPQSNGKTIRWCQVRVAPEGKTAADGGADVRGIVCGAHNFFVGDHVVVTLPGSVLPGPFPIAARKTYGHTSDGMIAAVRELALGDDHEGILRLSTWGIDAPVGTDALALLGLYDTAVEINVTPDRGYAFSIRGVAREYSHATGATFRDPASIVPLGEEPTGFPVSIDDAAPIRGRDCASVFVTRAVRGVEATKPTPAWMTARLSLSGIRSISLVVDITNYVMLELGQPIHGYDLDAVSGGLSVRRATAGEKLVTLDKATRTLDAEDVVITDESGAVGLAGVMGGARTEINADTTNVLIEAANFDPVSIARTARRHKLPSEASKRFERGVDPNVALAAAARVVQLLEQLAGGHGDALGSVYNVASKPQSIDLSEGFVNRLVGADFTADEERSALTKIGTVVEQGPHGLRVSPPSWRPDLIDSASLAEEVARIVGYDRIPSVLPVAPPGRGLTRAQQLRRALAQTLAAAGLTEVLVYPFVTAEQNFAFGSATGDAVPAVALANALDARVPFMRTSLIPGLVETAKRNLSRGLTDLALFEVGMVFRPKSGHSFGSTEVPSVAERPTDDVLDILNQGIPPQPRHVGALFLGNTIVKQPGQKAIASGIVDAVDAARLVGVALGLDLVFRQGSHHSLHPGRTAQAFVSTGSEEVAVGYVGELLPALAVEADLPRIVAVLELDLDSLIALAPLQPISHPICAYPAATQDLSLVVAGTVAAGDLLRAVIDGAGKLLESAHLVDDYRGVGLPEGSKSVTFALRFRASDRTLTAAEASEAKEAGAKRAAKLYDARVRE